MAKKKVVVKKEKVQGSGRPLNWQEISMGAVQGVTVKPVYEESAEEKKAKKKSD